jgi:hypothetical protein
MPNFISKILKSVLVFLFPITLVLGSARLAAEAYPAFEHVKVSCRSFLQSALLRFTSVLHPGHLDANHLSIKRYPFFAESDYVK